MFPRRTEKRNHKRRKTEPDGSVLVKAPRPPSLPPPSRSLQILHKIGQLGGAELGIELSAPQVNNRKLPCWAKGPVSHGGVLSC